MGLDRRILVVELDPVDAAHLRATAEQLGTTQEDAAWRLIREGLDRVCDRALFFAPGSPSQGAKRGLQ